LNESSPLSLLQRVSPQQLLEVVQSEIRKRNTDLWREDFARRGSWDEDGNWVGGLLAFVRHFWHVLEPAIAFEENWALAAICEHLEAVSFGEITRLLINVPPGFCKSLLTDVFWPAWGESALRMPHLRYVAFSYSDKLTTRDNSRFAALICSKEFQELYGDVFKPVNVGTGKVTNNRTGWKLASSIGGLGTGERGDRVILDDPHNVKEGESEVIRTGTVRWFREAMSNRHNNPSTGAIVIIMQRVHEADVSGSILEDDLEYCHLLIPMEYEPDVQTSEGFPIENDIGWSDPRFDSDFDAARGLLAWPERFPPKVVVSLKKTVGPFGWASQYQQTPEARGGGIFKRDYWRLYDSSSGKFPQFDYILASLDSAFTEKEQNDPSALTVWGIFQDDEGQPAVMLVHAWRKHLQFHGPEYERKVGESDFQHRQRTMKTWGLIEWTAHTCTRFHVDLLLIEGKASGISAAQELRRLYAREKWGIELAKVKGDKVARAMAALPTFSKGIVWAPDRQWAQDVIDEMAVFPKGRFKDLTDSATQAIKKLRDGGLIDTVDEVRAAKEEAARLKKAKVKKLYPV
jgi:predicted phage terminase large subunit-like protein